MMYAAMICGPMSVACSSGKDYMGTYETEMFGIRMGMTLNANGTATAINGDKEESGYFCEFTEKDGKVVITYGTKNADGQFTKSGSTSYFYEDGKLRQRNYTYTKK